MSQYNVLQAIGMSFYSKKLYRDVATNWGGKAFAYLLLLVALASTFITYEVQITLNQFYRNYSARLFNQIPVITVENGKLKTPEKRPYVIVEPESNNPIAIIDTSGQYTNLDNTKAAILVTEDQIITHNKNETKIVKFSETINGTLDPEVINTTIGKFVGYSWIILFIVIVLFSYVYRIIQALIYSLFGKLFASIGKYDLSYGQIMQIALVSITPVIVVGTILDFFIIHFPLQWLGYFILAMSYLFYGITANKK